MYCVSSENAIDNDKLFTAAFDVYTIAGDKDGLLWCT